MLDPLYNHSTPLLTPDRAALHLKTMRTPVAITGGTGFVGSHLVDTLCAAGIQTKVLARYPEAPRWIAGGPVGLIHGHLSDHAALGDLVRGAGTIIHLAGVLRAGRDSDFMVGNHEGTKNLIEQVSATAKEAHFIYISSQAALGPSPSITGFKPDVNPQPISCYGRSKLAAEQVVRSFKGRWTIIRPSAIYGPRDSDIFETFKLAARGLLVLPNGDRWLTVAYVSEVVRMILAAAASERSQQTYHAGCENCISLEVMLRQLAMAGGVRSRVVRLPDWFFRAAGMAGSVLQRLGMRRLPLTRDKAVEILARHWVHQTKDCHDALDLDDEIDFGKNAFTTWRWYREVGWIR